MSFSGGLLCAIQCALAIAVLSVARPLKADVKADFLARYAPASAKLQEFYRHIKIVARSTKTGWQALHGPQTVRLVFEANGPRLRIESTVIESHQDSFPAGLIYVMVANPEGSFLATKAPDQQDFVLRNLSPNSAEFDEKIRWRESLAAAPYQFRELTILEFFKLPDLEVTSVGESEVAGEKQVKVSYSLAGAGRGTFVFLPDKSWALRQYTIGRWDHKIVNYDGVVDGVPLLKRVESWQEYGDGKSNVETIEIEEIEPGDVASGQFTLGSVGIADVGPEVKRGYGLVLLVVAAVILAAVALAFRWLRRAA